MYDLQESVMKEIDGLHDSPEFACAGLIFGGFSTEKLHDRLVPVLWFHEEIFAKLFLADVAQTCYMDYSN